jgi:hypothetical protein
LFFYPLDAAQFEFGLATCLFSTHACGDFFLGEQRHVGADFLVEVLVGLLSAKQISQEAG